MWQRQGKDETKINLRFILTRKPSASLDGSMVPAVLGLITSQHTRQSCESLYSMVINRAVATENKYTIYFRYGHESPVCSTRLQNLGNIETTHVPDEIDINETFDLISKYVQALVPIIKQQHSFVQRCLTSIIFHIYYAVTSDSLARCKSYSLKS